MDLIVFIFFWKFILFIVCFFRWCDVWNMLKWNIFGFCKYILVLFTKSNFRRCFIVFWCRIWLMVFMGNGIMIVCIGILRIIRLGEIFLFMLILNILLSFKFCVVAFFSFFALNISILCLCVVWFILMYVFECDCVGMFIGNDFVNCCWYFNGMFVYFFANVVVDV